MEARILNLESTVLRMAQSIGKLEADMSHVQKDIGVMKERQDRDFRLLFGAIITTALGLGGLMAKGFGWL